MVRLQKVISVQILILAFGAIFTASAMASIESSSIQQELDSFVRDPEVFMLLPRVKRNSSGEIISEKNSRFTHEMIENRSFIEHKWAVQDKIILNSEKSINPSMLESLGAPNLINDNFVDLVDKVDVRRLEEIEERGLTHSKLEKQPWSDFYWATYLGAGAFRYEDIDFPRISNWKANIDYIYDHLGQASSVDNLSPTEKYDLYVGDTNYTLTKMNLEEGRYYYNQDEDKDGKPDEKVAGWMGSCHGWAAASYMLDRPSKAIKVTGQLGHEITFYPSDIKALATILWANGAPKSRFVGTRCNSKAPGIDPRSRQKYPECFDNNPASWHFGIVNQIGISKRSLVMDVTFDHEVWNQPLLGYSYTYFNPNTMRAARSLSEARVPTWGGFPNDRFRDYRTWGTMSVVGIVMDVQYMVETMPRHSPTDSKFEDAFRTVRYIYDLELDAWGNVIGGEWYTRDHPDFLWTYAPEAKASSFAEYMIDTNGVTIAAISASGSKTPLARVVEELIKKSNE